MPQDVVYKLAQFIRHRFNARHEVPMNTVVAPQPITHKKPKTKIWASNSGFQVKPFTEENLAVSAPTKTSVLAAICEDSRRSPLDYLIKSNTGYDGE